MNRHDLLDAKKIRNLFLQAFSTLLQRSTQDQTESKTYFFVAPVHLFFQESKRSEKSVRQRGSSDRFLIHFSAHWVCWVRWAWVSSTRLRMRSSISRSIRAVTAFFAGFCSASARLSISDQSPGSSSTQFAGSSVSSRGSRIEGS